MAYPKAYPWFLSVSIWFRATLHWCGRPNSRRNFGKQPILTLINLIAPWLTKQLILDWTLIQMMDLVQPTLINHDNDSLGDSVWTESKLPQGLVGLSEYVHGKGWSLDSGLRPWDDFKMCPREHPEWAIQTPGRSLTPGRQQLVLNMANPDVEITIPTD